MILELLLAYDGFKGSPTERLLGAVACGALLGGVAISLTLSPVLRKWRTRQFRRAVEALSPQDRRELLEPLCRDDSDVVRKMAAALVRDFEITAEIAPADAPKTRREPSPAEPLATGDEVSRPTRRSCGSIQSL